MPCRKPRKFTIHVEGNIGAGKSIFLEEIAKEKLFAVFPEPIQEWQGDFDEPNFLQKYYEAPTEFAFPFQLLVQLSIVKRRQEARHSSNPAVVFERSNFSNEYIFAQSLEDANHFPVDSFPILKKWYNFCKEYFSDAPDVIVYIRTNPQTALRRIQKRARSEEKYIDLDLIMDLHDRHEDYIRHKIDNDVPVIVIDGDADLDEVYKSIRRCIIELKLRYLNTSGFLIA